MKQIRNVSGRTRLITGHRSPVAPGEVIEVDDALADSLAEQPRNWALDKPKTKAAASGKEE